MKKLSKDEIAAILAEHEKWMKDPSTGRQAFFEGCEFVGFNFPRGCTVSDCTVSGGKVSYCTVSGGTVSYCTVSYCTVSGCTVSDCTVSGGTVSDCTVSGGKVSYCTVSGGTVSYCTVSGGKVSYCTVSYCTVSDCKVSYCTVSDCKVSDCTVSGGKVSYCTVSDCKVSDCTVSGGKVSGRSLSQLKGYAGLYKYNVWAVLFADGSRWVRMGCLFKSIEDWEKIGGIRKSNLSEFPDNGSDRSEERAAAFEFAKASALRMKLTESRNQ